MPKRPDPLADILSNHADYPDPTAKMSAIVLRALDDDDMPRMSAALDCLRIITCARTRNEAMAIAERAGEPRTG